MEFLKELNIETSNSGASTGSSWWSNNKHTSIDSINPNNEAIIGNVWGCSEKDYDHVIEQAHKTFLTWRHMPAPKRGDIVRELGDELRKHKDALGSLVAIEMGKSKQEGDGEVQEMIDMADFAVGQARMLYGCTMHSERPQHRMYEQWHPLGVVGVISAFNFPVAVWAWNAFIAAIAGNTVVWKPSSKTPLCAVAVQHICNRVMKKHNLEGVFSFIIPETRQISDKLLHDERIPLISFTGSTAAGRHVAQTVSGRFGKTILELGGNNAIIVDETANLKLAVPAIVFGAAGTAGQRCTTTRRLFVHESLFDDLIKRLANAYKQISIGDSLDSKNLMGPLIDKQAVQHYEQAVAEVRSHGGEIVFGGNTLKRTGYFVEPTIAIADNKWDVVQRETFAPILYVMKYQQLSDAIEMQNAVKQGLSSALFSDRLQHIEQFLSATGSDCGIANINIGTSGAEIGGAFGGEKETGGGREAGSDAWKAYMRRQTNTINWGSALPLAQGIRFDLNL